MFSKLVRWPSVYGGWPACMRTLVRNSLRSIFLNKISRKILKCFLRNFLNNRKIVKSLAKSWNCLRNHEIAETCEIFLKLDQRPLYLFYWTNVWVQIWLIFQPLNQKLEIFWKKLRNSDFHKIFYSCELNPCFNDPCGANADCESRGRSAVCRCRSGERKLRIRSFAKTVNSKMFLLVKITIM